MVVRIIPPSQDLTGWIMGDLTKPFAQALDSVSAATNIALREISSGDTVLKYGHDVAAPSAAIG